MKIDGVFSGGGIKGFALIGAVKSIEERGFTFERVAGTSAGSIISAFIAAGYSSDEMLQIMNETEFAELLDPSLQLIPGPVGKWLSIYFQLGLYKGKALEKWLNTKLNNRGIYTFKDLPKDSLRVVASNLSTGRMLILPDDLEKYGRSPSDFSVARAIRMSCAIPYFFQPVKLKTDKTIDYIVDGGVLSSFPMWLFDSDNVKKIRPVLGIKLNYSYTQQERNTIKNAIQMFGALFETMKEAHDARYVSRKHEKNIIFIPIEDILTTQFAITEEQKNTLVKQGYDQAEQFFKKWSY
ncbi:hypothetical protein Q75_09680 [Bacillus coahuilensis p1.1.43]|uniref:PNPLA domain-containing protein n=1 Tax=Bacillus coahuilensis p1.1.43 TaxID=1150625 RepID=A0A147K7U8_9BACI|nr:patatin-like phospholipase family protein [Bacillus coahuilensis]KUP06190.1 hypothetical protein Q75_09680 [Bacillus coahuilensis p1.1.43]